MAGKWNAQSGHAVPPPAAGGTALPILDMMNLFDFEDGQALGAAAGKAGTCIARLRRRFDAAAAPVIYVNDNFAHWQGQFSDLVMACAEAGGHAATVARQLAPRPHDYHVLPRHSGFLATPQRKRTALVVMRQALQGNVRPLRSVAGLFPAAQ